MAGRKATILYPHTANRHGAVSGIDGADILSASSGKVLAGFNQNQVDAIPLRPRLLLGLRITFSAFCGLVATLLVMSWVRRIGEPPYVPADIPGDPIPKGWILLSAGYFFAGTIVGAYPMLFELRFSLRALLLATTVVAVVLGVVVWVIY